MAVKTLDISIHALRVEGDILVASLHRAAAEISIHALRVEGDGCMRFKDLQAKISIHALRVEGDCLICFWYINKLISIHALRVEGDLISFADRLGKIDISIHALRVEGDSKRRLRACHISVFLSTPSGWRATVDRLDELFKGDAFLSTPSGWRATYINKLEETHRNISIHALRVEGDLMRLST